MLRLRDMVTEEDWAWDVIGYAIEAGKDEETP
jgi:hypothetical protein